MAIFYKSATSDDTRSAKSAFYFYTLSKFKKINIMYKLIMVDWTPKLDHRYCFLKAMDDLFEAGHYSKVIDIWKCWTTKSQAATSDVKPSVLVTLYCAAAYKLVWLLFLSIADNCIVY